MHSRVGAKESVRHLKRVQLVASSMRRVGGGASASSKVLKVLWPQCGAQRHVQSQCHVFFNCLVTLKFKTGGQPGAVLHTDSCANTLWISRAPGRLDNIFTRLWLKGTTFLSEGILSGVCPEALTARYYSSVGSKRIAFSALGGPD